MDCGVLWISDYGVFVLVSFTNGPFPILWFSAINLNNCNLSDKVSRYV